jgi:hypothetical protein
MLTIKIQDIVVLASTKAIFAEGMFTYIQMKSLYVCRGGGL